MAQRMIRMTSLKLLNPALLAATLLTIGTASANPYFSVVDPGTLGIFGHSMGGHGALTLALRHPDVYRSVSAFAPIAAPSLCPWGEKAFGGYLGADRQVWREHDASTLVEDGRRCPPILIDQGMSDPFLPTQLNPDRFEQVCADGQPLALRRHAGYDHGYYFISTFMADHLAHHAQYLKA